MNGGSSASVDKLVGNNYSYWKLCMEAYLQGQDLWDLISGDDELPTDTTANVEARRNMDYIEHVRDVKTPKRVWETLERLFTQKNTMRVQFLENELARIVQELDTDEPVKDVRLRRYLIRGLREEFMPFISSIQGWATQTSIIELENLLSNQEALVKQMVGVNKQSASPVEDALYAKDKGKGKFVNTNNSNGRNYPKGDEQSKKFSKECYRCGKTGHMKRTCRVKVKCDRCGKPGHIQ
ncbi:hypothetical protein C2S51_028438 [Perilla frutescens var. frutescens]|nr:hypothetical protein C2S51_028438 [Perilla frutescens var. frutescens]